MSDEPIETPGQESGPELVTLWIKERDQVLTSKYQREFERQGEKIIKLYRNADYYDSSSNANLSNARVMFNLLWSNVQLLKASYYTKLPKVVVERRFKDSDPIGRMAAESCERAISYNLSIHEDRYNWAIRSAIEDRLLPGRGQDWLRLEYELIPRKDANGQEVLDEDGNCIEDVKPGSESILPDHVYWQDYLISPCRNMYDTRWQMRRHYMTRRELVRMFGDVGKLVKLDSSEDNKNKEYSKDSSEFIEQAEVWEVWDFETKNVYYFSDGYRKDVLKCERDPLRLKGFYPCPIPLLATTTTGSIYPTPDYKIYERLCDEVDLAMKRRAAMIDCIRFVGATSKSFSLEVKNMLGLRDGQLWPIEQWVPFTEKGGFKGMMDWLPFENAIAAIGPISEYIEDCISKINIITGIPDIVQGASNPDETFGAQQLKSDWTVVKNKEGRNEVERFCRELLSKVGQILFEPGLFSDDTLYQMAGVAQQSPEDQALWPQALALLRSDKFSSFRIDIQTGSTIAIDEEREKQSRMEYMTAVNTMLSNIQNAAQYRPEVIGPMIESALFATRAFRTGRSLEAKWENAMKKIEDNDKAAAENPPPPPVDYQGQQLALMEREVALKERAQQDKEALQAAELNQENQIAQMKFEIDSQKVEIEGLKVQSTAQIEATYQELEAFKTKFSQFIEEQKLELEKYTKIAETKESLMEESRLSKDHELEVAKLMHNVEKEKQKETNINVK